MRTTIERIAELQEQYSSKMSDAMRERGLLVRHTLPEKLMAIGSQLNEALGSYGLDAMAQGRDNFGTNARIPWVRYFSKSRSPTARQGWFVVYLFHPDASGVSLCLMHGSTYLEDNRHVERNHTEVAQLMAWASGVVGNQFQVNMLVKPGVSPLGTFALARL